MGKFKKLQEDIENVTNKEVVKQTLDFRCSDYCVNYFGGMCHRWYEF